MDKYQVKILDIKEEYKNVYTYTLEKPEELVWDEGTSFHLGLPGYDEGSEINKKLIHHLSINTLTDEAEIKFTTKVPIRKSTFKKALAKLKVGDEVTIFKFKSHMALKREDKAIVLLSQGLSMSTMRPLIKKFEIDSSNIPELISLNVNKKDNHLYEKDFEFIDGSSFIKYWLESRSEYFKKLESISKEKADAYYYVVGSEIFVLDNLYILRKNGISDDQMIIDKDIEKRDIVFETLNNYKMIV